MFENSPVFAKLIGYAIDNFFLILDLFSSHKGILHSTLNI